jgi:hypothetical protein
MPVRLILHDLPEGEAERLFSADVNRGECTFFPARPSVRPCIGCFGCWVKTPGKCVINDRGDALVSLLFQHSDFIVISRLLFGGFSPDVKACLDRNIGYMLPFFRVLNGETHHKRRYETPLSLHYIFYGPGITEREERTARGLTAANALNLGAETYRSSFYPSADTIEVTL